MLRALLSSKLIQVGLVCFVLIVGGSLLYSWHVRRSIEADEARTQQIVKQRENKHEAHTAADTVDTSTVDFEQAETPLETDDSQVPNDTETLPIDETSEGLDMMGAFLPDDFVSEEETTEVPLSPFGFGPYPEVPDDYPVSPTWEREGYDTFSQDSQRELELLDRVLIKLWKQGERGYGGGGSTSDGKVYPHYKNTAYVRYETTAFGRRYISRYKGDPAIRISPEQLRTGELPSYIRVLDYDSEGINPYTYLDLP